MMTRSKSTPESTITSEKSVHEKVESTIVGIGELSRKVSDIEMAIENDQRAVNQHLTQADSSLKLYQKELLAGRRQEAENHLNDVERSRAKARDIIAKATKHRAALDGLTGKVNEAREDFLKLYSAVEESVRQAKQDFDRMRVHLEITNHAQGKLRETRSPLDKLLAINTESQEVSV